MFYVINARLVFEQEQDADVLFDYLAGKFDKMSVINPGTMNEEGCSLILERCYHDEPSPLPCEVIKKKTLPP